MTGAHKLVLAQRCAESSDGYKLLTPLEYNKLTKYRKANTRSVASTAIEYPEKQTAVDPYLFGLWLGDGKKGDRVIYNSAAEIDDYLKSSFTLVSVKRVRNTKTFAYRIKELTPRLLREKTIGDEYLINSVRKRKALLAGLLDSDGYLERRKSSQRYEIACYPHLTEPICQLCRSLGYRVSVTNKNSFSRIFIRGNDLHTLPVKIGKKKASILNSLEYNLSSIEEVKSVGVGPFIGFQLSDPYFLLEDYTVAHNCGMFSQLKDVYSNTVDNLRNGLRKTGMLFMLGTGGNMDKGTIHSSEMFYEPHRYDILPFDDHWENRGQIGYFLPAYEVLNEFKDSNGISNEEAAKKELLRIRKVKAGDSGGSEALNKEMQYRPIVPSEMFLTKTANIFPTAELRRRLSEVQTQKISEFLEKRVTLFFDPEAKVYNGVNYEINPKLNAITRFPYDGDDVEGAVVIYEFPKLVDNQVPEGAYIIGCDPYKDDGQSGQSLAAIYVIKTNKYPSTVGYSEIVANFIGRPYLGKNQVNEILYKLSLFYGNAKIYFENNVGNVKDYFEKARRLDLLARQPVTIFNRKASYDTNPQIVYGYPLSNDKVKWEALQYVRSFLLEDRGDNKKNLDLIPDIGLLQELISYNLDGNFDRVSSLIGCVLGLEEISNISRRKQHTASELSQFDKDFNRLLTNNSRIFNAQLSQATSLIPG